MTKILVMRPLLFSVLLLLIISCNNESRVASFNYNYCAPGFDPTILEKEGAPLFDGLGDLYYAVSTKSEKAQQYFNQGLTLAFAFNHGEAARSFREATRIDSNFAMGWWGYAWVLGPNINSSMDVSMLDDANHAIEMAGRHKDKLPEKERLFINAIEKRYPKSAPSDPKEMMKYNEAFAEEMRVFYRAHPNDVNVITILAEALLDLHPWNYWNKDGEPLPWVKEIQELLEKAIAIEPKHPGANHYYIHTMEASNMPEKALKSADLLRDLLPAAGHLVHMPSHIYIRTGRYHDGTLTNEKAALADSNYITQCKIQGMYPIGYFPHNYHFMAATAFFEGASKKSIEAAWLVAKFTDQKMMREPGLGTLQHYLVIPHFTMVHFGKWDDILKLPKPDDDLIYPNAIWNYARGMAYAAKNNSDSARQSLAVLKQLSIRKELESITIWELNKVTDLVEIAVNMLEGDIQLIRHRLADSVLSGVDSAILFYHKAAAIEDKLNYNEPPDWFFSTRHSLGYAYNLIGKYKEAEAAYRRDLFLYPDNGWSLIGLYHSLKGQSRDKEAEEVKGKFDEAWKYADVRINSSRVF